MSEIPDNFLGLEPEFTDPATCSSVILPIPYEGGVSWGRGAALGPRSIIAASQNLEFYDEVFGIEPHRRGILTLPPVDPEGAAADVFERARLEALAWLTKDKFLVSLGGDHSVTIGPFRAAHELSPDIACIQLDAHADLRDTYGGSPHSHACIMSRVRELTAGTLQIGIRSLCADQARRVRDENLKVVFMHQFRHPEFLIERALETVGENVYLTIDADVFDWSVIRTTGTPEPGGLTWDEGMRVIEAVFRSKNVLACDLVELSAGAEDPNSATAAAKIVFKMLAMKYGIERIGRISDLE